MRGIAPSGIRPTRPRFEAHPDALAFAVHYAASIICARDHSVPMRLDDGTAMAFPCEACTRRVAAKLTALLTPVLRKAVKRLTTTQPKKRTRR